MMKKYSREWEILLLKNYGVDYSIIRAKLQRQLKRLYSKHYSLKDCNFKEFDEIQKNTYFYDCKDIKTRIKSIYKAIQTL